MRSPHNFLTSPEPRPTVSGPTPSYLNTPPAWPSRQRPCPPKPTGHGGVPARGHAALAALALLLTSAALPSPAAAGGAAYQPRPIQINSGGVEYIFTSIDCAPVSSCDAQLRESFVWGKAALATQLIPALPF